MAFTDICPSANDFHARVIDRVGIPAHLGSQISETGIPVGNWIAKTADCDGIKRVEFLTLVGDENLPTNKGRVVKMEISNGRLDRETRITPNADGGEPKREVSTRFLGGLCVALFYKTSSGEIRRAEIHASRLGGVSANVYKGSDGREPVPVDDSIVSVLGHLTEDNLFRRLGKVLQNTVL